MLAMLQLLTRYHYVEPFVALPAGEEQKQSTEEGQASPDAEKHRTGPQPLRSTRAGPAVHRRAGSLLNRRRLPTLRRWRTRLWAVCVWEGAGQQRRRRCVRR